MMLIPGSYSGSQRLSGGIILGPPPPSCTITAWCPPYWSEPMNGVLIQATSQQFWCIVFMHRSWSGQWPNENASCLHQNTHLVLVHLYQCASLYVGLSNCSVFGNLIYMADVWIIPSHTARLSVNWLRPNRIASSPWNHHVSGKPSVVTCMGIGSKCGCSSAHSSMTMVLAAGGPSLSPHFSIWALMVLKGQL